jgi:hypothetical protein
MPRLISLALTLSFLALMALPAAADSTFFSTGNPDGKMATASRPATAGKIEIEAADDFVLTGQTSISGASSFRLAISALKISKIEQSKLGISAYCIKHSLRISLQILKVRGLSWPEEYLS